MIENTPVIRPQRCISDAILLVASGVSWEDAGRAEAGGSSSWLKSRSSSWLLIRPPRLDCLCLHRVKVQVCRYVLSASDAESRTRSCRDEGGGRGVNAI